LVERRESSANERGSTAFRNAVALSKFKNIPNFGEWPDGHILLQEHESKVHSATSRFGYCRSNRFGCPDEQDGNFSP